MNLQREIYIRKAYKRDKQSWKKMKFAGFISLAAIAALATQMVATLIAFLICYAICALTLECIEFIFQLCLGRNMGDYFSAWFLSISWMLPPAVLQYSNIIFTFFKLSGLIPEICLGLALKDILLVHSAEVIKQRQLFRAPSASARASRNHVRIRRTYKRSDTSMFDSRRRRGYDASGEETEYVMYKRPFSRRCRRRRVEVGRSIAMSAEAPTPSMWSKVKSCIKGTMTSLAERADPRRLLGFVREVFQRRYCRPRCAHICCVPPYAPMPPAQYKGKEAEAMSKPPDNDDRAPEPEIPAEREESVVHSVGNISARTSDDDSDSMEAWESTSITTTSTLTEEQASSVFLSQTEGAGDSTAHGPTTGPDQDDDESSNPPPRPSMAEPAPAANVFRPSRLGSAAPVFRKSKPTRAAKMSHTQRWLERVNADDYSEGGGAHHPVGKQSVRSIRRGVICSTAPSVAGGTAHGDAQESPLEQALAMMPAPSAGPNMQNSRYLRPRRMAPEDANVEPQRNRSVRAVIEETNRRGYARYYFRPVKL